MWQFSQIYTLMSYLYRQCFYNAVDIDTDDVEFGGLLFVVVNHLIFIQYSNVFFSYIKDKTQK